MKTVDFRRFARQLRTDLPQKSSRYDVANRRYHSSNFYTLRLLRYLTKDCHTGVLSMPAYIGLVPRGGGEGGKGWGGGRGPREGMGSRASCEFGVGF